MPSLEHVTVLVGRRGVVTHPLLRNIVNLAADRVVEINPDGEPVYLERVLQTSVDIGIGLTQIDQILLVQDAVVIDIQITRGTGGIEVVTGRNIAFGRLVTLDLGVVFPCAGISESPQRIKRIIRDIPIHHILRIVGFVGHHEILRADVIHHLGVVRQGKAGRPCEFGLGDIVAFDRDLDTLVAGFADVHETVRVTALSRTLYGQQQVFRFGHIGLDGELDPVIEHGEIERGIVHVGSLPGQFGASDPRRIECHGLRAAEKVARRRRPHRGQRTVSADGIVTRPSRTQAERHLADPRNGFYKRFVVNIPFERSRREEAPFVIGREVGRAIGARRESQIVFLTIVVIGTEQAGHAYLPRIGRTDRQVLLIGNSTHIVPQQRIEQITVTARSHVVRFPRLRREADHGVEMVAFVEILVVGQRIFAQDTGLVVLTPVSVSTLSFDLGRQRTGLELVGVMHIGVIGSLTPEFQTLDQFGLPIDGGVEGLTGNIVRIEVDGRQRRVELLSGTPQVVEIAVRLDQRRKVDTALPPTGSAQVSQVVIVVAMGKGETHADLQPVGELVVDIETRRVTPHAAVLDDASRIVEADRSEIGRLLGSSVDRKTVILIGSRPREFAEPVGPFAQ